MPITPEMSDVIASAIESALVDVHVALPGIVQSYDEATQTADIVLQVKRVLPVSDGSVATEEMPVLPNVPVSFQRSASFFVSLPIAAGDSGLVIFNEQSIDRWRSNGSPSDPKDVERHGLSGAVFVPGLFPNDGALVDAHATNMVVGLDQNNGQIHITPAGSILLGADATKKVAREGDAVEVTIPALTVVDVPGTGGAKNVAPITLSGTIKAGSATVKASD